MSSPQAKALLTSCVNRIPEALSLLCAVLPLSHLSPAAVHTWYVVCFPLLLNKENVPRDVLQFVEKYSTGLFR